MEHIRREVQFLRWNSFIGAALMTLSLVLPVLSAPGDLDPTFGNSGVTVTPVVGQPHWAFPRSILVQPDGKILVAGEIQRDEDSNVFTISFFLARYNPNGTLDATFGSNGKVVGPINTVSEIVGAHLALQPDGKIIAVGSSGYGTAVNRYNSDGTLDVSFGTGGKIVTNVGGIGGWSEGYSVAVQPDGKIVVVGRAAPGSGSGVGFAAMRYDPDGSVDTSFGDMGQVITVVTSNSVWEQASAAMLQPDGKIVAAGQTGRDGSRNLALIRYNENGSLDTGFGTGGKSVHAFPNSEPEFKNAVLQPDGKIVVAGFFWSSISNAIVRYNANGSLDTGFAANGIFISANDSAYGSVALQPDGKILSFGSEYYGISTALRLNANGLVDTGFGTGGLARVTFGNPSYGLTGAIQPDGRILLLGISHGNVAIARLIGDSAVSNSATISGRVTTPGGQGVRNATLLLTDAVGTMRTATTSSFGQYRFENVAINEAYTITVRSKRYRFAPRTVQVDGNLSNLDLVGLE